MTAIDYPDVEIALTTLLADLAKTGTRVPAAPTSTLDWLPFIRVTCTGGRDDLVTDITSVSIDTFAATKGDSMRLAGQVRQLLTSCPHLAGGRVIDRVTTNVRPTLVAYVDNPPPYRYSAVYTASARR